MIIVHGTLAKENEPETLTTRRELYFQGLVVDGSRFFVLGRPRLSPRVGSAKASRLLGGAESA
jgi:hypothetical protein